MKISRIYRRVRRRIGATSVEYPSTVKEVISFQHRAFSRAELLVRIFYSMCACVAMLHVAEFPALSKSPPSAWLWPVSWFSLTGVPIGLALVSCLYLFGSLLSALSPNRREFRITTFIGMLCFLGFQFSYGKIDHGFHFWLWASAILVLLPNQTATVLARRVSTRQYYLSVVFFCQVALSLFFTVAGVWKVLVAIYQAAIGEAHAFSIDAFARQIAMHMVDEGSTTPAGGLILANPILGWPLYLGAIYLEVFSLVAVSRAPLHRIWGIFLMLFRFGTMVILGFWNAWSMVIVALFFVSSPFGPEDTDPMRVVRELPLVRSSLRLWAVVASSAR